MRARHATALGLLAVLSLSGCGHNAQEQQLLDRVQAAGIYGENIPADEVISQAEKWCVDSPDERATFWAQNADDDYWPKWLDAQDSYCGIETERPAPKSSASASPKPSSSASPTPSPSSSRPSGIDLRPIPDDLVIAAMPFMNNMELPVDSLLAQQPDSIKAAAGYHLCDNLDDGITDAELLDWMTNEIGLSEPEFDEVNRAAREWLCPEHL